MSYNHGPIDASANIQRIINVQQGCFHASKYSFSKSFFFFLWFVENFAISISIGRPEFGGKGYIWSVRKGLKSSQNDDIHMENIHEKGSLLFSTNHRVLLSQPFQSICAILLLRMTVNVCKLYGLGGAFRWVKEDNSLSSFGCWSWTKCAR